MSNPNDLFSDDSLDRIFDHHSPSSPEVGERHSKVRAACKELARTLRDNVPASADRTLALRKLEECMFRANAAIARYQG